MSHPAPFPLRGRLYISAVVVCGAIALADTLHRFGYGIPEFGWLVLAALTWLSGAFAIKIPSVSATISVSEVFVFTLAILYGVPSATMAVAVDGLLTSIYRNNVVPRRLLFNTAAAPPAVKTLQGFSRAEWERVAIRGGARGGGAPGGGSLKVVTANLSGGWLRKNGVPYSDETTVIEYFDRFPVPPDSEWLVITTAVTDPKYLTQEFVTSTHFRREPDGSKWDPTACQP